MRSVLAYSFVALAVAMLLGACSGEAPSQIAPALAPQAPAPLLKSDDSRSKLHGETFTATSVTSSCNFDWIHGLTQISFNATGNATGPIPGTFAAGGFIGTIRGPRPAIGGGISLAREVGTGISEGFDIVTNGQKIHGHVYQMRAGDFHNFQCTDGIYGAGWDGSVQGHL